MPEGLATLVSRETDPRERRQLSIIRTEREIFERCVGKLQVKASPKRKPVAKPTPAAGSKPAEAHENLSTEKLVELARTAPTADVRAAVDELVSRALREGVRAAAGMHESVGETVASLVAIADAVEKAPGETLSVARWTRGRALLLLDDAVSLVESTGSLASLLLQEPASLEAVATAAADRISQLEKLVGHRTQIRALGAEEDDAAKSDDLWKRAAARAEDDACAILDAGFRKDAAVAFSSQGGDDLGTVLGLLASPLATLDRIGKRLAAVGAPGNVKGRVVSPRILPLVNAAFEHSSAPDRAKLVAQVEAILDVLEEHQLRSALAPRDLLGGAGRALVRAAQRAGLPPLDVLDHERYRKLRSIGHRVPGAYTLLELAMRVAPKRMLRSTANPEAAVDALHEVARSVPAEIAAAVAKLDIERLETMTAFLERWYESASGDGGSPQDKLERLVASGFFGVAFDEQALLRTALEARVVGDVFPDRKADADSLRTRLEALRDRVHADLEGLLQKRADEAWAAVLSP